MWDPASCRSCIVRKRRDESIIWRDQRTELLGNDEDAVAVLQDGGLAGTGSGVAVCVRRKGERYKWEIRMARLLQGMYPFPPNQMITHFGFVKM